MVTNEPYSKFKNVQIKRSMMIMTLIVFLSTSIFAQSNTNNNLSSYIIKKDSVLQTHIGTEYPGFKAYTLKGESVSESNLQNKITVINFWFQNCQPCIYEFESLNKLFVDYENNKDFQFISFTSDSEVDAIPIVAKYKLPFTVCSISREECYRLNFNQGFPTTIIVDKKGRVAYIKSGIPVDSEKIKMVFQKYREIISNLLNTQ